MSNDLTEEEEDATLHIITIHLIFAPIFLQSILAAVILKMVAVWVVIWHSSSPLKRERT